MCRQNVIEIPNMKFNEYPSRGSRSVSHAWTDRHGGANSRLSYFFYEGPGRETPLCFCVSFLFIFLSPFELRFVLWSDILIRKLSYVADTEFPPHCSNL
jgi:hypothetical protein